MSKIINISRDILKDLYLVQEKTIPQISEILGCSTGTIWNKLKLYGIQTRKFGLWKIKYTQDEHFFENKNFYWAGFIAADGHICSLQDTLEIKLCTKDLELLKIFKKQSEFTGPIRLSKDKRSCRIGVNSKKWISDLEKYFCVTRHKTYTLQGPKINNLQDKLKYVIGYIDGDGCITIDSRRNRINFSIYSNYDILSWISDTIHEIENKEKYKNPLKIIKDKRSQCYYIQCGGNRFLEIVKVLKSIETPYKLDRKWSKVI